MSTKDHVLRFLEAKKGQAVSGSEIAEALSLSRAAVWKAVHALQEEGYPISAASKRGYSLAQSSDILSSASILPYLKPECTLNNLHVYKELASTNTTAKAMAKNQGIHHAYGRISNRRKRAPRTLVLFSRRAGHLSFRHFASE